MKFNIFDESTWAPEVVDIERKIADKAIGHIGQMITTLRGVRVKLIEHSKQLKHSSDYMIAQSLPIEAAKCMDIRYEYPDDKIANSLMEIDFILGYWTNDVEYRRKTWRTLIPHLEAVKEFCYVNHNLWAPDPVESILKDLTIKVTGNAAWTAYLSTERLRAHYCEQCNLLNEKLSKLNACIEDDLDDDYPDSRDYD